MRLLYNSYCVITVMLFLFVGSNSLCSQNNNHNIPLTIPEIAILDIEPNTSAIVVDFTAPTEAGDPITGDAVVSDKWINYTSCIASGGTVRSINVSIDQMISGVDIKLQAATAVGGGGVLGTPEGEVVLTTTPILLISNIGGAYTGDGGSSGHQLTYSLEVNDYALINETVNETIVVTYTISN